MGRQTRPLVLATLRKRVLFFTILLAAIDVGWVEEQDVLPGSGRTAKMGLQLGWALSYDAFRKTHGLRYFARGGAGVAKSEDCNKSAFYYSTEQRFRGYFWVDRATIAAVLLALRRDARSIFFRSRGGTQVDLQLHLAITLYRLGHYGNACSVDAVADLFGVSVGAVVTSSRRVVKALVSLAPVHIRWPNAQRREHLSSYAASKFGYQGCIGATDGTTIPLAYQPALHSWTYYDRK